MPRTARELSNTDIYHVIFRGNDRQDIFYDDQDRKIFLKNILETKKLFNYEIYSYCLMNNHVHMIIKVKDEFFSKAMQSLAIRYSLYFNKKFERRGHLFENKFVSKKIEDLGYFIHVCKYVHRNPEKAEICKTEEYNWSSFKEYIKEEKLINKKVLLHYFNNNINDFKNYTLNNDDKEELKKLAEYELITKLNDDELSSIITKQFDLNRPTEISILDKNEKDKILKKIKEISGTNISQIARITKINRRYLSKI